MEKEEEKKGELMLCEKKGGGSGCWDGVKGGVEKEEMIKG